MSQFDELDAKGPFSAMRSAALVIDCRDRNIPDLVFAPGLAATQNQAGVAFAKGELLEAMEKGQRVLLRHLDMAKPGTLGILHGIAQLANGEIKDLTLYDPLGGSVSLTGADVKGFQLTASMSDPGPQGQGLPESLKIRLHGLT